MTYGEKRRAIAFSLDDEKDRVRYEFSKTINLTELVKRAIDEEIVWQQANKTEVRRNERGGAKTNRAG